MKVKFNENFKKALKEVGNTIVISHPDTLWNKEHGCLELTLREACDSYTVEYENLSGVSCGEAFTIEGPIEEIVTYFTIKFPGPILAKVVTKDLDQNIKFLEKSIVTIGKNIFLGIEEDEYPTKLSLERYVASVRAPKNEEAPYLNVKGEEVRSIRVHKEYKGLTLEVKDLQHDGNEYYVSAASSVYVTGKVTYDLYRIDNGVYTLVQEDAEEGIGIVSLVCSNPDVLVSQDEKKITFTNPDAAENTYLHGELSFESLEGVVQKLSSDPVRIVTYVNWTIDYSTDLFEKDGTPVFLFDTTQSPYLWNPLNLQAVVGCINVYTTEPRPSIEVDPYDARSTFETYFSVGKSYSSERDPSLGKYCTKVSITPKKINNSDKWYPLDAQGNSALIKCYLKVNGTYEDFSFYCVQRAFCPLVPRQSRYTYNGPCFKNFTCSVGPFIQDYDRWEATVESERLGISQLSGIADSDFSAYVTAGDRDPGEEKKLKFVRRRSDGSYDPTYWKDLMYCSPINDTEIIFEDLGRGKDDDADLYVYDTTDYFYTKGTETFRLLVFPRRGDTKEINIYSAGGIPTVQIDNDLKQYFEIVNPRNVSGDIYSMRVVGNSIEEFSSEMPSYDWWPKVSKTETDENTHAIIASYTEPASFTLTCGPKKVKVYMVYRPGLEGTISFEENDQPVNEVVFPHGNAGDRKEKTIKVVSNLTSAAYNYWFPVQMDSEVVISSGTKSYDYGDTLFYSDSYPVSGQGDIEFSPMVVQRSKGKYTSLFRFYEDWENQLVDNTRASLGMKMAGLDSGGTLKITTDTDTETIEVKNGDNLNLTYIGIYKIYVKSSGKFRVSISNDTNEEDGFYFFDPIHSTKITATTKEYGSYSPIFGTEVAFMFVGGERDSFEVQKQLLRTKITVTSLDDGSRQIIGLERTYFEDVNLEIKALTSTLTASSSNGYANVRNNNKRIIFLPSTTDSISLEYLYYLDPKVTVNGGTEETHIRTSLNSYSTRRSDTNGDYIRSRGYLNTVTVIEDLSGNSTSYPLTPISTVHIEGDGDNLDYKIYQYDPVPEITLSGSNILALESYSGASGSIEFDTHTNFTPTVDLHYYDEEGNETIRLEGYNLTQVPLGDGRFRFDATAQRDYVSSEDQINKPPTMWAKAIITSRVQVSNLLADENISDYDISQNEIETYILKPTTITIEFWRLGLEQSENTWSNDTSAVISYAGDNYSRTINKKASFLVPHVSGSSRFIQSYSIAGDFRVDVVYRSRLDPNSLAFRGLTYNTGTGINITNTSWLKNIATPIDYPFDSLDNRGLNFAVEVGSEIAQPGNDTLYTTGITQSGWTQGIKIGSNIYLGTGNTINLGELEYNVGSKTLYTGLLGIDSNGSCSYLYDQDIRIEGTGSLTVNIASTSKAGSVGSETSGYAMTITIPANNSSVNDIPYSFTIRDTYGNSITISFTVKHRTTFSLSAYTNEAGTVSLSGADDKCLVFDASGRLVSSGGYLYVKTECPDPTFSFEFDKNSSTIKYQMESSNAQSSVAANKVVNRNFSVLSCSRVSSSGGNYIYRVGLRGRINEIGDSTSRLAYILTPKLVLRVGDVTNSVELPNCRFGYGRLTATPRATAQNTLKPLFNLPTRPDVEDENIISTPSDVIQYVYESPCYTSFRLQESRYEWKYNTYTSTTTTGTTNSDIDLHLYGPDGLHVYYGNKSQGGCSLDRDITGVSYGSTGTEILSVDLSQAVDGDYHYSVKNYSGYGSNVRLSVTIDGKLYKFNIGSTSGSMEPTIINFTIAGGVASVTSTSSYLESTESTGGSGLSATLTWVGNSQATTTTTTVHRWDVVNIYTLNDTAIRKFTNTSRSKQKLYLINDSQIDEGSPVIYEAFDDVPTSIDIGYTDGIGSAYLYGDTNKVGIRLDFSPETFSNGVSSSTVSVGPMNENYDPITYTISVFNE